MFTRYRWLFFFAGWVILCIPEFLKVYYIMPMPGSQESDTVELAYFLAKSIAFSRFIGGILLLFATISIFKNSKTGGKIVAAFFVLVSGAFIYLTNFVMLADKMFLQPEIKIFVSSSENKIPEDALVLGIEQGNEAKAYPITLIGYHHQVRDTVGGVGVMITYCTVCRTGRAFSPLVDGKPETFRLVGMDHFNAMFEDKTTKSWWRQATGEAITGEKKGSRLDEIPSQQTTLKAWLQLHPNSLIMQPDKKFEHEYAGLNGYDKGNITSSLVGTSKAAWDNKSWVVGIDINGHAVAYDWNYLQEKKLIQDTVGRLFIAVVAANDGESFYTWNRELNGEVLTFKSDTLNLFSDDKTNSLWDAAGVCVSGTLAGQKMKPVQSYQEFWHSWRTFHPATEKVGNVVN